MPNTKFTSIALSALSLSALSFVYGVTFAQENDAAKQDQSNQIVKQSSKTESKEGREEANEIDVSDEFRADIVRLTDATGDTKARFFHLRRSVAQFKVRVPGVKKEFWDECDELLKREGVADFLVPIYAKYFTHEETQALVAFFESPVGKKYLKTMRSVTGEANVKTNELGRQIGEQIGKKLKKEGYVN